MAQQISSSPSRRLTYLGNTDAAVTIAAAGVTDIIIMDVSQIARLVLEIINSGARDLDAFIVQGLMHPNGSFQTILSAAADYTTPAGIVVDASGDLTVLASGTTGWLIIDVLGFQKIKLRASSNAAGSTVVSVFAGGS